MLHLDFSKAFDKAAVLASGQMVQGPGEVSLVG